MCRPKAEENILYRGCNICRHFTRKGFEYLVYYIGYSLRGTTVSVAIYPLTMRSIRGGTLGWNIEIYSTPMSQFDWSVSRAYVINIIIYYIPPPLTVHFPMTRSVRYRPILHTLYYTLTLSMCIVLVTAF